MLIVLILGPLLEEIYGSAEMIFMMLVTALVTGITNVIFFNTSLMGASDIVFMLILLGSFTNFRSGEIPLTFILVLLLYVGKEVIAAFGSTGDGVAHFAHIAGGLCGSLFGFFQAKKETPSPDSLTRNSQQEEKSAKLQLPKNSTEKRIS
jgi:membrane associated rhomboid family serine protease